jgi:hypothetical protein
MRLLQLIAVVLALTDLSSVARSADPVPIRTMLHGGMTHEPPTVGYLEFVEQVKPDILVMGVFDQRLYSQPAPMELLTRWKEAADRLHRSGIRLVGHMELNVVSDRPADLRDKTGFIGFYDKAWDEKLLGRRPTVTAAQLLEEPDLDAHAAPAVDVNALCGCRVNTKALMACINKPAWRDVQKRMVKAAVDVGVDGFITNRNFFGHCACEQCRNGFRKWLGDHHSADELKARFGISDLAKSPPTCVVGMHRIPETVPDELVLEKQRFAKHMVKDFFDEVYVRHGRGLRPDLITSQWNHMAYFDELHLDRGHLPPTTRTTFSHAAADERWSLSPDLWARDESLLWYCNWGTTQNTILEKEYAGDTVLYGKLIRALAGNKPYVVNKYDYYRPRNTMAEAAALGYATNAINTSWQNVEDREVVLRYFAFLKKHESAVRPSASLAEVGLVFPRRSVHAGDAAPLEYVEAAGRAMIRRHVLFDVLPDDLLAKTPLESYRTVVVAAWEYLEKAEREALTRYASNGGRLLLLPVSREDRERPGAASDRARRWPENRESPWPDAIVAGNVRTNRDGFLKELDRAAGGADRLSRFDAPWLVEVHAYRQPAARRLVLHFVNYNHRENVASKSVSVQEAPIAAEPVTVCLQLPEKFRARTVCFRSPDDDKEYSVEFRQNGNVLECKTPGFLVYGLCLIEE